METTTTGGTLSKGPQGYLMDRDGHVLQDLVAGEEANVSGEENV